MAVPADPEIRSIRNERVAAARRLHRRQGRLVTDHILLEGPHLAAEALAAGLTWHTVFYTRRWADGEGRQLLDELRRHARPGTLFQVTEPVLAALTTTRSPQGVVGVAAGPAPGDLADLADSAAAPVVCLDGLQDPGNVGAVLRTAYALGAIGALIGPDSADPLQPKVLRAGAGMMLHLPLVPTSDLPAALARLQAAGRRVIGLTPRGGVPLPKVSWGPTGPVLVVGSEGRGIAPAVLAAADQLVTIPLRPGAESLNTAVAAAIALYEAVRSGFAG